MLNKLADIATLKIINYTLKLNNVELSNNKTILIFYSFCELSKIIGESYLKNLEGKYNSEFYIFDENKTLFYKELLLNLNKNDTVILVQSTNFRLENFRIRMILQQKEIACIEHNHLSYIKNNEYETYLKSIGIDYENIDLLSRKLKSKFELSNNLVVESLNGSKLEINGGFEDMKRNSGIYDINSRYVTFPAGENFTESLDFLKVNGELYIKSFPGFDFVVRHLEKPFKITIEKSIIIGFCDNTPKDFIDLYDKILDSEGEVMIRELGFGLNPEITFDKQLNDVNAFERMQGFHISLGKKHNIYRKKLNKNIIQKYHIDIFPLVKNIKLDEKNIFINGKYNLS